ncbi:MAG TPA: decarboxylating 6-phosphogluconate dehydrogenase [Demequinaceae bacterium]
MATDAPMQLGMIGLGRMGSNMVRRLMRDGHACVVYDLNPDSVAALVAKLDAPRSVWVMVPAGGITGRVIAELAALLEPGDAIIDGGNSYYRDDIDRSAELAAKGITLLDCGTSGGVWGLDRGYCLMIGGDSPAVARLDPIFRTIAPGAGDVERTPGRTGPTTSEELGYLHCGPSGAGHFVKMVHNGIEDGLMAAYAEGFNVLRSANIGRAAVSGCALSGGAVSGDAETAPLANPEYYQFDIDTTAVAEVWRRGSVVGSWLLDLTATALLASRDLEEFSGHVSDSGEGRWTSIAAIDEGVPTPVLTSALFTRFASRDANDFADKVLSAMRKGFGGHEEKKT